MEGRCSDITDITACFDRWQDVPTQVRRVHGYATSRMLLSRREECVLVRDFHDDTKV